MLFLAKRARDLRVQQGLTQAQFAERAGFNHRFYQNIESGRNKYIRLDTVDRLANAHQMEIGEFLTPPDDKYLKDCQKRSPGKRGRPRLDKSV